jgi:hypothetical protein
MSTKEQQTTVETIQDKEVWRAIADGINTLTNAEAVFEFSADGFEVVAADPAQVALIGQSVDAADFDEYDAGGFRTGVNTADLADVLSICPDKPVRFDWDMKRYKFVIESGDVEYELPAIDPETIGSHIDEIPNIKEKDACDVDVDLPVDPLSRAVDLTDMTGSVAEFQMSDDGFVVVGHGDDDASKVRIHESDAFAWRDGAPTTRSVCKQSNEYLDDVVGLLDQETVRFVTGTDLPYRLSTTRAGVIDTQILQAPRLEQK